MENNKTLFDCMITCGELDPDRYGHYKEGTVIREVVKHNVTREEALAWHGSAECMKRVYELEGPLDERSSVKTTGGSGKSATSGQLQKKTNFLKICSLMFAFYYVNKFLEI